MKIPDYSDAERLSRDTFLVLLQATGRPGTLHTLPSKGYPENFACLARTLLDLETTYFTADPEMAPMLHRIGARESTVENAHYHFWPVLRESDLDTVSTASRGTPVYPEQGVTLFVGCTLGSGDLLTLTGPGIPEHQSLRVSGIPSAFWLLRNRLTDFPLGWDVCLVDGESIAALPRSTTIALQVEETV